MSRGPQHARLGAAVLLLGLLAFALGCSGSEPRPRGRVLLIGIDGATMRVAEPLMKEGRMPVLSRIAKEGVSGRLRSEPPLISPPLWASIATGKRRDKHGIDTFARGEPGAQRLLTSQDRRTHALWNILSDRGMRVGVVNWWNTYPPEKVNGVMVSDHVIASEIQGRQAMSKAEEGAKAPILWPEEWSERVLASVRSEAPMTAIANPFAASTPLPSFMGKTQGGCARRFVEDGIVTRIALDIEQEIQPDLLMVFLPGIDRVSHALWGVLEPGELYPPHLQLTPDAREMGRRALFDYYAYTDALIGKLIEHAGPEDLLMVVSDHGFEAGVELMYLTGTHKGPASAEGVIFARGPGIARGSVAKDVSILDVTPTILAWLGLPVAADMDGRPASFLAGVEARLDPIATYDTTPIERVIGETTGSEEAILEQLRQLGYVQ